MEFFEALQTFIIDTKGEGLKEVTGTRLTDDYFAFQSDVKSFGWTVSDKASGVAVATKLPTLKACRDYVKNIPDDTLARWEQFRLSDVYKAQCKRIASFKSKPIEPENVNEAFDLLDSLYEVLDQKTWDELMAK